jgi:hypothetical protein
LAFMDDPRQRYHRHGEAAGGCLVALPGAPANANVLPPTSESGDRL